MKFEQSSQFNPEEKLETQSPAKEKVLNIEKAIEQPKPPELKRFESKAAFIPETIKKSPEDMPPQVSQEVRPRAKEFITKEENIQQFAESFRGILLEKLEREKKSIKDKDEIKNITKIIRKALVEININTLEQFAKGLGVACVLKTPLVASAGGGVTELNDGRKILLYYNLLPWHGKYALAHEVGHIALGHLAAYEGRRTLKEGVKCEWDAERFASSLTRIPRPIAWIGWGVDGLLSNIPKLFNRFRKKEELKKIMEQLGHGPETEIEVKEILDSF